MSKQIYLHIPEPCHENWEAMTPVQQGRFCQSCSKEVVDFSRMSDKQILDVLSKAAGKTCGRFISNQLERPIVKEIPYSLKPYKIILSSLVPAFIISGSASCQDKSLQGKVAIQKEAVPQTLVGETIMVSPQFAKINGSVVFENRDAVAGASVMIKGTKTGTATDAEGNFSLNFTPSKQSIILVISYVGNKPKEVEVKRNHLKPLEITLEQDEVVIVGGLVSQVIADDEEEELHENKPVKEVTVKGKVVNKNNEPLPYATVSVKSYKKNIVTDSSGNFSVALKAKRSKTDIVTTHVGYRETTTKLDFEKDDLSDVKLILEPKNRLEDVTVSSYPSISCTMRVGGLSVVRRVTVIDTAHTFVQKLFNNEMFKAYPNPVAKGQNINLTFKKAGDYTVQLFDNSGKLYIEKNLKFENSNQISSFTLPASISSGFYYLKAINTSANKQFIDKLIIQ